MNEISNTDKAGKGTVNWTLLSVSLVAMGLFSVSFFMPFVSSDFDVVLPDKVTSVVERVLNTRDTLKPQEVPADASWGQKLKSKATNFVKGVAGKGVESVTVKPLDRFLGPVDMSDNAEPLSWQACLDEPGAGQKGGAQDVWQGCLKRWIVRAAGVPVGVQTILGIITGLLSQGEVILGLLLLIFSVLFPLSKVLLCCFLTTPAGSLATRRRAYWFLEHSSKWSMTDVFVVAMLITFFKAESFNFHFQAEMGLYTFAAAAILSSFAVVLIKKDIGSDETQTEVS